MPCDCAKSWLRVRLKAVGFFVRSVVFAVVFSVAGLSSALVICVTGCSGRSASTLTVARATPACHDSAQAGERTISNEPASCAHEPASLIAVALAFDMRPSLVASPSIASVSLAIDVMSNERTTRPTASRTLAAQRPSTTLRI